MLNEERILHLPEEFAENNPDVKCVGRNVQLGDYDAQLFVRLSTQPGGYRSTEVKAVPVAGNNNHIVSLERTHYGSGTDHVRVTFWDGQRNYEVTDEAIGAALKAYCRLMERGDNDAGDED